MAKKKRWKRLHTAAAVLCCIAALVAAIIFAEHRAGVAYARDDGTTTKPQPKPKPVLDKRAYDRKLLEVALATTSVTDAQIDAFEMATSTSTSTPALWPVKAAYPNYGALLPFHRIIAYYGNFYSKQMGVLGEYPHDEMIAKLQGEVDKWNAADPTTPVIPAIDYIAITAQASPIDGTYRARMPDSQIQKAIALADEVHGIVILDMQVGLSTLQKELPLLAEYLKRPEVHLALDPEFSMKTGDKPGDVIGTFDATDINYATQFLAQIVRDNDLTPKILVIHRFTQPMVTHYKQIKQVPEVQIVMDMDGWGPPAKKINTYQAFISPEPVQFTGFKLFYKNDLKAPSTRLLTPEELLKLKPQPLFIQFQ